MSSQAVFLTGSLFRHVMVMSLTSSLGLMAIFAVDFIDMVFIAMLGQESLAAAVGYAGTLLFFTNAINIGISISAGILVARNLGSGDQNKAREFAISVMLIGAVTAIVIATLVGFYLVDLLALLGARGEALRLATEYTAIILPTMPLMSAAMIAMAVLRSHGDAKRSMLATFYGGAVNALLDPLFIFTLEMELAGAALASVLARVVILATALAPLIKVHNGLMIPSWQAVTRNFSTVFELAIPSVLTNLATPFGAAIVTREIAKFGNEAVAGMAVIGRLTPFAFAVILALSGALGPIVGQNFGAGKFERVKQGFYAAIQFSAIYILLVSLGLFGLREVIADLFNARGQSLELLYLFCGPLALFSFFNALIFSANACLNNLGHPIYSTWINWGRNSLGTLPLVLLGAAWFGASGVLIGQAVGGVLFALIAFVLTRRVIEGLDTPHQHEPFLQVMREHILHGRGRW